ITHGDAPFGAGLIAARRADAAEIVDPRGTAIGSIATLFEKYDHVGPVLPAMGYNDAQRADLAATIAAVDPDVVVSATPHNLEAVIEIDVPVVRVRYELKERNLPLDTILERHADRLGL
ncbi:MAG: GTPase, partial [Salinarchaeum sp.]